MVVGFFLCVWLVFSAPVGSAAATQSTRLTTLAALLLVHDSFVPSLLWSALSVSQAVPSCSPTLLGAPKQGWPRSPLAAAAAVTPGAQTPRAFCFRDPSRSITPRSFSARGALASMALLPRPLQAIPHLQGISSLSLPFSLIFSKASIPGKLPKGNICPVESKTPSMPCFTPYSRVIPSRGRQRWRGQRGRASFSSILSSGRPPSAASPESAQPRRCSFRCSETLQVSEQTRLLRTPGSLVCAAPARLPPHAASPPPPRTAICATARAPAPITAGAGSSRSGCGSAPGDPEPCVPPSHRKFPFAAVRETAGSNLHVSLAATSRRLGESPLGRSGEQGGLLALPGILGGHVCTLNSSPHNQTAPPSLVLVGLAASIPSAFSITRLCPSKTGQHANADFPPVPAGTRGSRTPQPCLRLCHLPTAVGSVGMLRGVPLTRPPLELPQFLSPLGNFQASVLAASFPPAPGAGG